MKNVLLQSLIILVHFVQNKPIVEMGSPIKNVVSMSITALLGVVWVLQIKNKYHQSSSPFYTVWNFVKFPVYLTCL